MAPQIIFGTASFGMAGTEFQDVDSVDRLLRTLMGLGIQRLDSGARYPPTKPGRAEQLIGEARETSKEFIIDTKVFTDTSTDGSGDLTAEAIQKSITGSLERLQRPEGVNVLHIHRADPATPLEEQIHSFSEQIRLGHCKSWGISNVPPPTLEKMLQICDRNAWPKPSCYQGLYNIVTHGTEDKLLPILRSHGIKFNAFQPLGGGFLTGKLVNDQYAGTRFSEDNPLSKAMKKMYGGDGLLEAMRKFDTEAKAQGATPIEVAIRWLAHHSPLLEDDSIVIGASKTSHVTDIMEFIGKGPLPSPILGTVEEFWNAVRDTRGDMF